MDFQVVWWEPPVFNTFVNNVCCHDMSKGPAASIELENYPTKILIKERCCTTVPINISATMPSAAVPWNRQVRCCACSP